MRIWFEGFSNQNALADLLAGILTSVVGALSLVLGRFVNTKAIQLTVSVAGTAAYFTRALSAVFNSGFQHWGIYLPNPVGSSAESVQWFAFYDAVGGGCQVSIAVDSLTGTVSAYRGFGANTTAAAPGGVLLGASTAGIVTPGIWYSIEIYPVISPTVGAVTVRVNGTAVLTLALQNTQNTSTSNFDTVYGGLYLVAGTSAAALFTDAWFNDTTTSYNNSWPGPGTVLTRFATSNSAVQFTPKTAEANYLEINETAMDGDTSYNSSAGTNLQDTFLSATQVPVTNTPISVKVQRASRQDAGSAKATQNVLISNGTTATTAPTNEITTYVYDDVFVDFDPSTNGTWTAASVLASTFGYEQTA